MAQIESNMAFMSPNPLHYVLICITLHHRVIKYVILLHLLILGRFMLRFCRKSAFFWKIAIISEYIFARSCVHARTHAGYLGEYRSDRSEIWRDDAIGYLQQMYLGDKGLVNFFLFF